MSLSLETHTQASCQSLLGISMTFCTCFWFCSSPQHYMSSGDFTQQELWVSHLHFLTYCVDRAGSIKGKKNHFEENACEHLMEVLFPAISLCSFNVPDLFIVKGHVWIKLGLIRLACISICTFFNPLLSSYSLLCPATFFSELLCYYSGPLLKSCSRLDAGERLVEKGKNMITECGLQIVYSAQ